MRYTRFITFFLFAALAAVGLSACDFSEQNIDIEPGDELEIRSASGFGDQVPDDEEDPSTIGFQRFAPEGEGSFYIIPFTIEKEYSWSVEGPGDVTTETRREGEFLDLTFDEPGDYTISIESSGQGEEYSGSFEFEAVYPDVGTQGGRFSGLVAAYGTSNFQGILEDDDNAPYTVLAPSSDALVEAFGETEDGDVDFPTSTILEDVVQYHVLVGSLRAADIGAQEATIIEGVDATVDASITEADIPATNGLVHVIDQVLAPPFAIVDFPDQPAEVDEESGAQTVTIASVYLPDAGFVVIEDENGNAVSAASDELDAGFYNGLTLELDDDVTGEEEYSAAVYEDSALTTPYEDKDGNAASDSGAVVPPVQ